MFEQIPLAPPDSILGLTDAFRKDPNPAKINLGVGVYKDENDQTPVLESVKRAELRLLQEEKTKNYLAIPGAPEYGAAVRELLFGADHPIVREQRAATAQTPGGTGGLRVAADFIHKMFPGATVWVSDPTWPNHPAIFQAAGLKVARYPYYDAPSQGLAFDKMVEALGAIPRGDVVVLHACCHNPSGIDPTAEQWRTLAGIAKERGILPLFDFAYQGFGDGLNDDAAGLRAFCDAVPELLVVSSFSKNFGLYKERAGALTVVAADADAAEKAFSQIKVCIRANYSNPPAHGGAVVTTILGDPELRALWEQELKAMRERIHEMRALFVDTLKAKGVKRDYSFIARQKGMFSFSGLSDAQVNTLRDTHAIYIVGGGRMNVAGMTRKNMDRLCDAVAQVEA